MKTQTVFVIPVLLALWLSSAFGRLASAEEGWRTAPGYPYGDGADVRTVWDYQPEYSPRHGYWSVVWVVGPSGCYEQMRQWTPPRNYFTGRVTLQPQRRIYQTFRRGNTTYTGWSDADYGLFR